MHRRTRKILLATALAAIACAGGAQVAAAQVGIGLTTPRGALDINANLGGPLGLVLPPTSTLAPIVTGVGSVAPGTLIYDEALDCIRVFQSSGAFSACLQT